MWLCLVGFWNCAEASNNGNVVLAVGLSSEPNLAFPGTPRNEDGICRDASDQRDAFFVARVAPRRDVLISMSYGSRGGAAIRTGWT